MERLGLIVDGLVELVRANRRWMGWNLLLAYVPLALALVLFDRSRARTVGWWLGVTVFVLFLPNAPYVVTDLIHLRWMIDDADSGTIVLFGVFPLMTAFVVAGYVSYLWCIELVVREVRSVRPDARRWPIELTIHAVCAVGVVLGRIARLNSWDTVANPRWTIERVFNTLEWSGAPLAGLQIFAAIVLLSTVMRLLWLQVVQLVRPDPAAAADPISRVARSGSPGS